MNTPQPAASRQTQLTSSRPPDLCPRRIHKPLSGQADFCESRGTARRCVGKGRISSKRGPFLVPKTGPLLVPKMGPKTVPLFAPFCENGIGTCWESYYGPAKNRKMAAKRGTTFGPIFGTKIGPTIGSKMSPCLGPGLVRRLCESCSAFETNIHPHALHVLKICTFRHNTILVFSVLCGAVVRLLLHAQHIAQSFSHMAPSGRKGRGTLLSSCM